MKFTINWLRDHLDFKHNLDDLVIKLNSIGLEVESYVNPFKDLNEFKIVEIIDYKKHPDADRLNVCNVTDGKGNFQIVCGANNVKSGLKSVLAPVGSFLPKNNANEKQIQIKQSKIRGVDSMGMLCSESELCLSDESSGIIDLPSSCEVGKPFSEYVDDEKIVVEIGITPNRVDCAGVIGIARDLHASGFGKFKLSKTKDIPIRFQADISVKNLLKNSDCPEFCLRKINNVKNPKSPNWLIKRFNSCDMKLISSLVDITNFYCIDSCRPLHVFDFDKITGNIVIRHSKSGEKFLGLDGEEYILDDGMIVICDDTGIISLAGILGGMSTSCDHNTKNILVESAYFKPESIASTGRKLNIVSEARYRFERGVDPLSTHKGLDLATNMINEICGGEVGSTISDGRYEEKIKEIEIDSLFIEKLLGQKFDLKFIEEKLQKIGCNVSSNEGFLKVSPPSWRGDISLPEDLVEEVARLYGYENIEDQEMPNFIKGERSITGKSQILRKKIGRFLVSRGLTEVITWSFVDEKYEKLMQANPILKISNPISEELSCLRSNLVTNLLLTIKSNIKRGYKKLNFFEIGPTFFGIGPGEQYTKICGIRYGKQNEKDWLGQSRDLDMYDAKSDFLGVLSVLHIREENLFVDQKVECYFHPKRSGSFYIGKNKVGSFGIIHPNILKEFGIKSTVSFFEIEFSSILNIFKNDRRSSKSYVKPLFQSSTRDFSFIVDKQVFASEIISAIKKSDNKIIKSIRIFDSYEGEEIGNNKKAIALEVLLQSEDKTLSDNEIEEVSKLIIKNVENKCNGKLR